MLRGGVNEPQHGQAMLSIWRFRGGAELAHPKRRDLSMRSWNDFSQL